MARKIFIPQTPERKDPTTGRTLPGKPYQIISAPFEITEEELLQSRPQTPERKDPTTGRTLPGKPYQIISSPFEITEEELLQSRPQREQDIRTEVPTNPAGSPAPVEQTAKSAGAVEAPNQKKNNLQEQLGNIIATGEKKPRMATLINPTTGAREVVRVESQEAQELFGQGFVLEQEPGTPVANARTETIPEKGVVDNPVTPTEETTQGRLEFLRDRANKIRSDAFNAVYGFTPNDWQDLAPSTQRRLRNQRVQTLSAELGNINDAITQVKEETETERGRALQTLNTYLEYGVLDAVDPDEKTQLAERTGLDINAINKIAERQNKETGEFELRQLGSDLVTVKSNPETGEIEIADKFATAPKTTVRTGAENISEKFEKRGEELRYRILDTDVHFVDAFNSMRASFPDISDEEINSVLGGSFESGTPKGTATIGTGVDEKEQDLNTFSEALRRLSTLSDEELGLEEGVTKNQRASNAFATLISKYPNERLTLEFLMKQFGFSL